MEYSEKLKDPRWQKKRLEIFNRDNWTCLKCKSKTKTLHIHHKKYRYGLDPWEYENDELDTLCCDCHESEGENETKSLGFISEIRKLERNQKDKNIILSLLMERNKK